ncbi:MAG: flagellar hook protein FlgE, partial [Polyangiales bacterium]
MSILRSMNTGAAGLRAHGAAIGVTGDNIANVNTVGFKKSRGVFEDLLGRSIAGSSAVPQAGAGSRLAHIQQMWTQGALLTTEAPTDLAISGGGFFMVEGNAGGIDGRFYTRAGQFSIDAQGQLVNPNGLALQGYTADASGAMGAALGSITVGGMTLPASATTTANVSANLDANEPVLAAPWDPADPSGTSNFSTSITTYDSLGNAHEVTVYYRKTADNAWDWHAMVDGGDVTGGTAGVPFEGASGSLTFTTDGALDTETVGASSWDFVGATPGQTIDFDFGESIAEGGTGFEGTTQLASDSVTTAIDQNGFRGGNVSGIAIAADGTVTGVFSNGQRRVLGQVALADFASEAGLERAGSNLWAATDASGEALVGTPGAGGLGSVVAGALEGSNVDIGQ